MPQPQGPKDPLQPPPPGVPAVQVDEQDWRRINDANRDSNEYFKALKLLAQEAYGDGWEGAVNRMIEKVRAK